MHPWHDVELEEQAPKVVAAVIEVPAGSNVKYELDKRSGLIQVRRFFEDYKVLEHKTVSIEGFLGAAEAIKTIEHSLRLYTENRIRLQDLNP